MMQVVVTTGAIRPAKLQSKHHRQQPTPSYLQAGYPSYRPTNIVKAMKTDFNTSFTDRTKKNLCAIAESSTSHKCNN